MTEAFTVLLYAAAAWLLFPLVIFLTIGVLAVALLGVLKFSSWRDDRRRRRLARSRP